MPSRRAAYTSLAKPRVRTDPSRSGAPSRLYDRRWSKLRRAHLRASPLCVACEREGAVKAADLVDHIVPVKVAPERRLDPTNIQSLCTHHHHLKTATDRQMYG
jgi:5-methylcytosine-specific restriction protein A